MLTCYIQVAMRQATYELLEDGTFYGEIPPCKGVWSNADSLEACREELQDSLELDSHKFYLPVRSFLRRFPRFWP